mmetsp:Transcript_5401/g.7533  ORF Transcript_5401/g.7533 Transcript_5401/m.7533 type:complete len:240 (+) Transcript_5401:197-916(+)
MLLIFRSMVKFISFYYLFSRVTIKPSLSLNRKKFLKVVYFVRLPYNKRLVKRLEFIDNISVMTFYLQDHFRYRFCLYLANNKMYINGYIVFKKNFQKLSKMKIISYSLKNTHFISTASKSLLIFPYKSASNYVLINFSVVIQIAKKLPFVSNFKNRSIYDIPIIKFDFSNRTIKCIKTILYYVTLKKSNKSLFHLTHYFGNKMHNQVFDKKNNKFRFYFSVDLVNGKLSSIEVYSIFIK